jgi:hypothetical protein
MAANEQSNNTCIFSFDNYFFGKYRSTKYIQIILAKVFIPFARLMVVETRRWFRQAQPAPCLILEVFLILLCFFHRGGSRPVVEHLEPLGARLIADGSLLLHGHHQPGRVVRSLPLRGARGLEGDRHFESDGHLESSRYGC